MPSDFQPLRNVPENPRFQTGDVLVVFGEVFQRGYVNGLIDEAKALGMKVIYGTVGRRGENGELRPLTEQELTEKQTPLINVPLEAGFDLQKNADGTSPVESLQGLKLSEWNKAELNWEHVEESRTQGRKDFQRRVQDYLKQLETHIPAGANVLFAHTMAGGVPRAKIVMPVMNRVFKGAGDRYASSKEFWDGTLGRLCDMSFMDVTANTLTDLIELSAPLRKKIETGGGNVSYVAYGYHGNEILMNGEYRWQSYSPYLQGFAKLALEDASMNAAKAGVKACVFNAPEILTNSSSIFLGVEVALYPLMGALLKEGADHPRTRELWTKCSALLADPHSLDEILDLTNRYFLSETIQKWSRFDLWPQHNGPEQMALMKETSQNILNMHKDQKQLLTAELSEAVFRACGKAMIREGFAPQKPVWWIGHDQCAKLTLS